MCVFCSPIKIYLIDLLARFRLTAQSSCLCLTSKTVSPSSGFVVSRRFTLLSWARTTGIEDISNTNSYFILSRSKQLFKRFCSYKHTRKYLPSFLSCRIYNSLDSSDTQMYQLKVEWVIKHGYRTYW